MSWKNLQTIVLIRDILARTTMIRLVVRICDVVDLFPRKPFKFFLRIFSISCLIHLSSRVLYTLAAMKVMLYTEIMSDLLIHSKKTYKQKQ